MQALWFIILFVLRQRPLSEESQGKEQGQESSKVLFDPLPFLEGAASLYRVTLASYISLAIGLDIARTNKFLS